MSDDTTATATLPSRHGEPVGVDDVAADPAVTLLLFSPDSTTTASYPLALAYLSRLGIDIVCSAWVRVSPACVAQLWGPDRARAYPSARWDLIDRHYEMDLSLACLVRGPDARTAITIRRVKGSADPRRLHPGQLRWLLGVGNVVLDHVHASDGPEETVHELGLLTQSAGIESMEAGLAPPPADLRTQPSVSVYHAVATVKHELIARLHRNDGPLGELRRLIELELRLSTARVRGVTYRETMRNLWEEQLRLCETSPDAVEIGEMAAVDFASVDIGQFMSGLASAGSTLGPWPQLILESQRSQCGVW